MTNQLPYRIVLLFLSITFLSLSTLYAQEEEVMSDEEQDIEMTDAQYAQLIDSINARFQWQTGMVDVGDGMATLNVPRGYKYLGPVESNQVLTDYWGNPPSNSLGMLFLENDFPLDSTMGYVVDISFEAEGYVEDDDADDIDYDELLETMQQSFEDSNPELAAQGYPTATLLGWAQPPYYDSENKKLHWAKEILFSGYEESTLNYDIRILGRKGYLVLTVIGDMDDLPKFKSDSQTIISAVNFSEGHRYEDFDSSIDEVAAYGIGGLIAGKVLMKMGLLAKLGVFLAKFWKFILIGVVAIGAGIRKMFGIKKTEVANTKDLDQS